MSRKNDKLQSPDLTNPTESKEIVHPHTLEIRDIYQQVLVLHEKTLIAVPDDGNVHPTTVTATPCLDQAIQKDFSKGNPIYLGIEKKLCLHCAESGGQPTLELEDLDIMNLYHAHKVDKTFVFYRNENGNKSTFESAAYPGWFISSSRKNGKPIKMTKDVGKDNVSFYLKYKN